MKIPETKTGPKMEKVSIPSLDLRGIDLKKTEKRVKPRDLEMPTPSKPEAK